MTDYCCGTILKYLSRRLSHNLKGASHSCPEAWPQACVGDPVIKVRVGLCPVIDIQHVIPPPTELIVLWLGFRFTATMSKVWMNEWVAGVLSISSFFPSYTSILCVAVKLILAKLGQVSSLRSFGKELAEDEREREGIIAYNQCKTLCLLITCYIWRTIVGLKQNHVGYHISFL